MQKKHALPEPATQSDFYGYAIALSLQEISGQLAEIAKLLQPVELVAVEGEVELREGETPATPQPTKKKR